MNNMGMVTMSLRVQLHKHKNTGVLYFKHTRECRIQEIKVTVETCIRKHKNLSCKKKKSKIVYSSLHQCFKSIVLWKLIGS